MNEDTRHALLRKASEWNVKSFIKLLSSCHPIRISAKLINSDSRVTEQKLIFQSEAF